MRKIGMIDVGSNTIKMAVYELQGKAFSQCWYHAEYAYLVDCIQDHVMTEEGIQRASRMIGGFQRKANELGCGQVYCFSTASLRWVENQQQVIGRVREACGVEIHPITGEEEAWYNFLSMKAAVSEPSFLGGDLGGGSAQLFCCEKGELKSSQSFPIGALKLKGRFVSGDYPTAAEAAAMQQYVGETIGQWEPALTSRCIYFMGGSMRLIARLLGAGDREPVGLDAMKGLLCRYLSDLSAMEREVSQVQPERLNTLLPGLGILCAIGERFGAEQFCYLQNSVREGLLIQRFLDHD